MKSLMSLVTSIPENRLGPFLGPFLELKVHADVTYLVFVDSYQRGGQFTLNATQGPCLN
jgi:hypothetical protein